MSFPSSFLAQKSLAQKSFDSVLNLHRLSGGSKQPLRLLVRVLSKIAEPVAHKLAGDQTVVASVYGRSLRMPAEHRLPTILAYFPRYNRPLGLAAETLASVAPSSAPLTVIDVGANIGDTIAILEECLPGRCAYLCIEPDRGLAAICRSNHSDNPRVHLEQCFIGEDEGASVRLENDGRANPSTKLVDGPPTDDTNGKHGQLRRLDTVAKGFAESHGALSLIKVDTEGYDFSVLRSGSGILAQYQPGLYFEWYPRLIRELGQEEWKGFEDLAELGYRHFVFYTNNGDFYAKASDPDRLFLGGLAALVLGSTKFPYFDVFATTSETVLDRLVERSVRDTAAGAPLPHA